MQRVYIALGSNQASPEQQANAAIAALKALPKTRFVRHSRYYCTKPLGPQDQPDYLNAVIEIETELSPLELLDETQRIEREQGRVRKAQRWGPRTLDLDILLFGDCLIHNDRLTVPHYDMKNREFMLYPLFEIAPELIFPDDGIALKTLIANTPKNGMIFCAEQ